LALAWVEWQQLLALQRRVTQFKSLKLAIATVENVELSGLMATHLIQVHHF
jgi:hypothetical protein